MTVTVPATAYVVRRPARAGTVDIPFRLVRARIWPTAVHQSVVVVMHEVYRPIVEPKACFLQTSLLCSICVGSSWSSQPGSSW